ncbi:MAG: adenine phosphoribosyltransferase [Litorimonas sp.]
MPPDFSSLKATIRTVPDFPKPGVQYRDITTLLADPEALKESVRRLADPYRDAGVTAVAGIDARGFIFGTAVAIELGVGFIPVRKAGKLPFETLEQAYELEYGTDTLQIHADAAGEGDVVLLVDDLIATGGTAAAAVSLLRRTGCEVVGAAFLVDLPNLGGAERIRGMGVPVTTLVAFAE